MPNHYLAVTPRHYFRGVHRRPDAAAGDVPLVVLLGRIAERKGATPAQFALAWLLAQREWIVPIPGTTKLRSLDENLGGANLELTSGDLREVDDAAKRLTVHGDRYPAHLTQRVGR